MAAELSDAWQVAYEQDLRSGDVLGDWLALTGDWSLGADGIIKRGRGAEGVMMLRVPVARGAIRITYEARADASPGDLSLFLGMDGGDYHAAFFFGFGSQGNSVNRLHVPERLGVEGTGPLITPGAWHRATVLRDRGRLSMEVDGSQLFLRDDDPHGLPGPYIGFYCWNEGVFRSIRVENRRDPFMSAILTLAARSRETDWPQAKYEASRLAWGERERSRERDELRREALLPQQRSVAERSVLTASTPATRVGTGSVAAWADGSFVAAHAATDAVGATIQVLASESDARSWQKRSELASDSAPGTSIGITAWGTQSVLLTWAGAGADTVGNSAAGGASRCARSTDGGRRWQTGLTAPVYAPHGPIALADRSLAYLGRGLDERGTPFLGLAKSDDGGKSWELIWQHTLADVEQRGMHAATLAETADGRLIGACCAESSGWAPRGGQYASGQIWCFESSDGGRSWSVPQVTPMRGLPHLSVLSDGRIMCCYAPRGISDAVHERVKPRGQRACFSEDGGRTWDIDREVVLRNDAEDHTHGLPSSVQLDATTLVTLYTQRTLGAAATGFEQTRWQPPPRSTVLPSNAGVSVTLAAPVTVTTGPLNERRWGFYQFPQSGRRTRSGDLVVVYQTADDSHGGGARLPNTPFVSSDEGRTWHEQTEAERDAVCLPFVLADGTELAWQGFARLRASELGMEPVRERVLTGNDTVVDVYRYDDIPADRRRMRMRRRAADGRVEDYEATLAISDLAVRRYKYGYNSEAGTMELPDDLMPIDLPMGDGYSVELADGTLAVAANSALRFRPDGAPMPETSLIVSEDQGRSWHHRSTVFVSDQERGVDVAGEPSITCRADGTLVCVVRSDLGRAPELLRPLWVAISHDDGHTWEPPRRLAPFGVRPRLVTLENGVTACVYGRPGVEVRFTVDPAARDWSDGYTVRAGLGAAPVDSSCGYTSTFVIGPDRLLIAYSDFYERDAGWGLHKAIKVREIRVTPRAIAG